MMDRYTELAAALAEKTEDAYSFSRYVNWQACALLLLRLGYSADDAETILRSKWLRWAADASENRDGRCTSGDLRRFMAGADDSYYRELGVPIIRPSGSAKCRHANL